MRDPMHGTLNRALTNKPRPHLTFLDDEKAAIAAYGGSLLWRRGIIGWV